MIAATVVVVGDTDTDHKLRELVGQWTDAGLLRRSFWVHAAEAEKPVDGPQQARLLSRGGEHPVGLLRGLGGDGSGYDLVRVLCVHVVATDTPNASALVVERAREITELITANKPRRTELVKINLVIPATGVSSIPRPLLMRGWSANVLASPEDRASQDDFNIEVRPQNLLGHAALHTVTVGGLWDGTGIGPFDNPAASPGRDVHLTATRCFARVVHGAPIVDLLTSRILVERTEWPLPLGLREAPATPAHPDRVLGRLLEECAQLEGGVFRFRLAQPPTDEPPIPVGFFAAFRNLFTFLGGRLRAWPAELAQRKISEGKRFLEQVAQQQTYGQGSRFVVRIGGPDSPEATPRVEVADDAAAPILAVLDDPPYVAPIPTVWETLRRLSFSLVDGRELPIGFTAPLEGPHREVFTDPLLIAPDPSGGTFVVAAEVARAMTDLPTANSDLAIRPCDPYAAQLVSAGLDELIEEYAAEDAANEPERDDKPDALEPVDDNASEPEVPGDENASEADSHDDAAAFNQTTDYADHSSFLELIRTTRDRLAQWRRERSRSLLWQLGERVGDQLARAHNTLRDSLATLESEDQSADLIEQINRRRRSLRRVLLIVALVALVGVAIVVSLGVAAILALGLALVAVLFIALGWLIASFIAFLTQQRAIFRLQHRLWEKSSEAEFARQQAIQSAIELNRLTAVYEQLVEWAEIIGWVVHHPWGPGDRPDSAESVGALDSERLPGALAVATATADDEKMSFLATQCSAETFREGWLQRLYSTIEDDAMQELLAKKGLGADAPPPNPDADIPRVPTGARSFLRQALERGSAQGRSYRAAVQSIAEFCHAKEPEELFDTVEPVVRPEVEPERPDTVANYLARALPAGPGDALDKSLWSDEGLTNPAKAWRVFRTTAWVPAVYLNDARFIDRQEGAELHDARIDVEAGRAYVMRAIRIDFADSRPLDDFRVSGAEAVDSGTSADSQTAAQPSAKRPSRRRPPRSPGKTGVDRKKLR